VVLEAASVSLSVFLSAMLSLCCNYGTIYGLTMI
jgi:hypothetical protein